MRMCCQRSHTLRFSWFCYTTLETVCRLAPNNSPQLLSQSQKSYHNTADVPGRHTADHLAPSCVTARPTPLAEGGLASLLMAFRAVVLEQVGHLTPSISPSSTRANRTFIPSPFWDCSLTFSTPALLYQLLSKMTHSPAAGSRGTYRCRNKIVAISAPLRTIRG